jgi:sialate O-acetylesterase
MQWSVERSQNAEQEISNADYPNIRLFQVALNASAKPLDDVEGEWQVCSPQSVPSFSAVGYFFGQELYHKTDIAIGLIQSAWGGTPAESWTTTESIKADRVLAPIVNTWDTFLQDYPDYVENFAQYHDKYQDEYRKVILKEWRKQAEQAREQGLEPPPRPKYPGHKDTPQVLYNAMIAPLMPYAIQGAIWYQGESNANRAFQYRSLFPTLIRDWRAAWDQDDFPFYFVQLANYRAIQTKPVEFDPWPELREAQLMTLKKVKNTGMAVIIDIGEADDIHPKNKQDVGQRLARWALAECYDQDVVKSGPIFKSVKFENDKAILSFDYVDGGLMTSNNEPLKGFAIAGADSEFVWAEAKIQGDQIIAWHPSVDQPISVRYAWANNPVCNLYNKAGLPASPFRTEDWPAVTRNDLKP